MKNTVAITMIMLVLLLLLMTACQTVPASEQDPAGSTPSSSSSTPPSSSAVPGTSTPATSIPATSAPATNPPEPDETGYSFVYDGTAPFIGIDADCSGCAVGYLYWVDKASGEVTPILEEPAFEAIQEGAYVYYVKTAEPTKIFRTPIWRFSQHEMIYESSHGKVSAMVIDTFSIRTQTVMQFVADSKKFVVLDMETGKATLVMEQYYIERGLLDGPQTDTWEEQEKIFFIGKPTADHELTTYRYYCDTGEVKEFVECEE